MNTFTVDTVAPSAPVVVAPANGSYVTTVTPTFSGTAEANSKVRIYVDGVLKDSVTADGSGNWSKVSATLTSGSHTIKATSTDAAGNTSGYSNINTFTVDITAPSAPVVSTPANGSTVVTTTPTFSGTAEANSKVRIYIDGVLVDSVTADGTGNWSKVSATLTQGSHSIKATSTDAAGNTSAYSSTNTFTVDTVAPDAPVVTLPADGSTVTTTTPTFSGTAEANSKVRIYVDAVLVDSTTADGSGNWSKVSATLSQGNHTIKVTATDAVGNTSVFSNMNTFTIDTVAPSTPVVSTPVNGSYVTTATPTFSGTAEANSKVRIYVDGALVDSTTADESGNWSKVSATLSQGNHSIKVTATDAAGNTSGYSSTSTFSVDTVAPSAPVVATPVNGSYVTTVTPTFSGTAEANSKVRIYIDGALVDSTTADGSGNWSKVSASLSQGSHTIKVTATDAAGNTSSDSNTNAFTIDSVAPASPVVSTPANGSTVTTTTPMFSGTAEANSKVRIYVDGVLVDSTTADGSGNWTKVSATLSQGSHSIKATATDAAENTSGYSTTNTFTVDTVAPSAPVVVAPANGAVVATQTPTFSGTAEVNSKVRIYVDGGLVDSVTADGSGNWSKVSASLTSGSHTIKATSTDAAGNTSGYSNINTFTVDVTAPSAPVVSTPANGSAVATTTPTFSGTAEANSKVRIYVDGVLVDSTTADGSGNWSKVSTTLTQGSHAVKTTATDAAGNTSAYSSTNTFTVDTVAPNAPVVALPANGSTVTTTTPTFSGTAEANSKVRIYVDGVLVDSTTADGSGNWSKVSATLAQGSHTIKATAIDAAGNTSTYSNTNIFTVDSIAPSVPVVVTPADNSYMSTVTPTFSGTAEANSKVKIYVDGVLVDSTTADGSGAWSKVSATLASGSHTVKATATDGAGNSSGYSNINSFVIDVTAPNAPVVSDPANGSILATATPTLSGTAEAYAKVRIYIDGILKDSTTANGSGTWSMVSGTLNNGSHTVKATAVDSAGNVSGYSNTNTFTINTSTPTPPVIVTPANNSSVATTTPVISGTADPNDTIKIYVDGNLFASVLSDGSGAWTYTSSALTQGTHTVYAKAINNAGTSSSNSSTTTFTVDTAAPATPTVSAPANGSYVTTTTPTLSGTAEANSKVRIYIDGLLVDSTTADGSGNWTKVSTALTQGGHTIKVTASDAAGNTSGYSSTNSFTIDTIAPNAPVVSSPADNSAVNTITPTFIGTAEATSKVRIYVDGVLVDSTTADGSGNWSKVSASLSQGSHTIKVTSTDAAGNTSVYSNINTFLVDTVAPGAPLVLTPANGATVATLTPTFSGTAEASSTVRIYVDGVFVDSTTADGSGNWSKVSTTLSQGSHTIKATSVDAAGNVSAYSTINTFTVDTVAPDAPVVILPANGSSVATTTPTFSGTAEANSTVRIYVDGVLVDSTTADGSGNWSKVSASLPQGSHTVKAKSVDGAGNTSGYSNINTFTIDVTAANAPVVILPADESYSSVATPTFSGTAEAASVVRLYIDGILIDSTTADGSGNWSKLSASLSEGSHTIKATSVDAAGNVSVFSNINTFTIDTNAPGTPVVLLPADGSSVATTTPTFSGTAEAASRVRLYVDGSLVDSTVADGSGNWNAVSSTLSLGSHTIQVTAIDGTGNVSEYSNLNTFTVDTAVPVAPVVLTPQDGSSVATATPTFSGTAEAFSKVRLYVDGSLVDSTTADGSGTWNSISALLSSGSHTINVTSVDAAGNSSVYSNTNTFTVDIAAPSAPVVSAPADGSTVATLTPTFSGTAEASSTVRLYVDGVLVDSTTTGGTGLWSSISAPLTEGSHTIKVTAVDEAGNTSVFSNINTFTVDIQAPGTPVVVTPADNSYHQTTTPLFAGTAEANSTVRLYVDNVLVDSTVADGSGAWSTVSATLDQGSHTLKATATDIAGNTSGYSNINTFTIDTDVPATPVVISPEDNSYVTTATPLFTGTAEATTLVRIYVDGSLVDSTISDGSGNWNKTSALLSQGSHTIKVTSTDAAGNTSGFSNTNTFTVDTIVPVTPVVIAPVDGSTVNTTTPTFSGTAEANSRVRLYVDNILVDSTVADGSGNWSAVSAVLAQGSHTIKVTSTDTGNNTSEFSNSNTFTVDTFAPNAPVVESPADNSYIVTTTPVFSGTAEINSLVRVYVDGVYADTARTDGSGNWSVLSAPLSQGDHDVKATSTDAAGNTSGYSNVNTFTISSDAPPVTIITPVNGSTINSPLPSIHGTTDPNLTVIITVDGTPIDTVIANGSGEWASLVRTPLLDGQHTISATAQSLAGITATVTTTFTVDTVPPAIAITQPVGQYQSTSTIPTIAGTTEPYCTVVISIDGIPVDTIEVGTGTGWSATPAGMLTDGPHVISVTSTDPAGNSSTTSKTVTVDTIPPTVSVSSPSNGSVTSNTRPPLSGLAEENAGVVIYVDGSRVDSVVAIGGTWLTSNTPTLSEGEHTVYAVAWDIAGNHATSTTNHFTVDFTAPAVAIVTPANGSSTNNAQPPITGTADVGVTVILTLDGVRVDTIVIPANGQWSYLPPSPLSSATHTVVATATDDVGNTGTASSTFTIDIVPPLVTITSPTDGALLTTSTPTITGTAEMGSTVRLYIDDTLVTTFTQNGSGFWSFGSHVLAQGSHGTFATATDAAGNMATSNLVTFTIDTAPPSVAVITPVNGSVSTDNTPLLTGSADAGCTVRVYLDSVLISTFVQDGTGSWSIQHDYLADGFHRIYATATDSVGNMGTSATNIFRIVTVPVLTNISPNTKRVGDIGFTMTVTGLYFLPTSLVYFDGVERPTTYVSPTELLVTVSSADMDAVEEYGVTVVNPAPGGGTSQSLLFTVIGASISGTVYFDGNKNGIRDVDEIGLSGWAINAVASDPANSRMMTTGTDGMYSFTNLEPDLYTISEVSKPLWTVISPSLGSYSIFIARGFDTTGLDFGNYVYADTGTYRTFTVSELATKKAISKRKCNGFKFAFEFTNKTGRTANGIYVEFNNVVTEFTNFYPFEEILDLGQNAQDFKYLGAEILDGQTVRIEGYSVVTPCRIRIGKWWWLAGDTNISKKRSEGPKKTSWFAISLPMPNPANVRDEVFGSGLVISYGLIAGVPSVENSRKYAWVDIRKSNDLYGSLYDRAGLHSGTPRGFTNGPKAGAIVGRIKKLPPSKFNNKLFGNLLTLKFNIWASTVGITPTGFGELVYQESDNPLAGMMIKDIASKADTLMTFWKDIPSAAYINIDTTIDKLNQAFSGPMDTIQFALRTKVTGFQSVGNVPFLKPNYGLIPKTAPELEYPLAGVEEQIPDQFMLNQNYPNPFNPTTTISFGIPDEASVTIKLYDLLGREIATLLNNEWYEAGLHAVEFTATNLPSGTYFYRMTATTNAGDAENGVPGVFTSTKKMILVK